VGGLIQPHKSLEIVIKALLGSDCICDEPGCICFYLPQLSYFSLLGTLETFKGPVPPKMQSLSQFTHPHVVSNPNNFRGNVLQASFP